nr:hypothetical protein BaRGS_010528 [Batillaria attramentaria]
MRGKLYGYKHGGPVAMGPRAVPPTGTGSHVNLAGYQAFAMQQRALLQQALAYESYLQSAAVTQAQMFPQPPPAPLIPSKADGIRMCMPGSSGPGVMAPGMDERREPQRSPIKLEQVTPPSTPGEAEAGMGEKRMMTGGPQHHGPDSLQHSPVTSRYMATSTAPGPVLPVASPLRSPPMLLPVGQGGPFAMKDGPSPLHHSPHQLSPQTPRGPLPSFSSFRHPPRGSGEYEPDHIHTPTSMGVIGRDREADHRGARDDDDGRDKYPCDSVMDLSVNKSEAGSDKADTDRDDQSMPPRRPQAASRNARDRIEFMFHTVWHVKYPHTIPNYQPFKENLPFS